MSREYGQEFPERPLMSTLSDLLGIPHFSTSRGSTVRTDFLRRVAQALGVDQPGVVKEDLIRHVWEAANEADMPDDRLSNGGTVTNLVLQEIIDGILIHGKTPQANAAKQTESDAEEKFDPAGLGDTRERRLVEIAQREGRDRFRTLVLNAYGSKCAITGTSVPAVLDAAHIVPYRGNAHNVVSNGLCLRRDVHGLFDRGMIAVDEGSHEVITARILRGTEYGHLGLLRLPQLKTDRPSNEALRAHRVWANL